MLRRTQRHLSRPVQLPDHHTRIRLQHPAHRACRNHVPTREHLTHTRETPRILLGQHPEKTRRHMHVRQVPVRDQPPQHRRVHTLLRRHHHSPARQQRNPQLIRRRVKSMRRMKQHPPRLTPTPIPRQPHHVPMRGHNTLRRTRRTRRIHHIRGGGGRHGRQHHVTGHVGEAVGGQRFQLAHAYERMVRRRRVQYQHRGARVLGHRAHPRDRPAGIQRHEHPTGLQDRQQRHHQLGRTLHQHRDGRLRRHSRDDQHPCQPLGPRVQLGVTQRHVTGHQRGGLRRTGHLTGERFRHRHIRYGHRHCVPYRQNPPALVHAEHVHPGDPGTGVPCHRRQHLEQPFHQPRRGVPVEEAGGHDERAVDARGLTCRVEGLAEAEIEIELERPGLRRQCHGPQTGQDQRWLLGPAGVLQGHHDLEQRMTCEGADGGEFLHEPFERHVLVRERRQRGLPDPAEHLGEAGIAGQVGPHHQRVDEEPHQVLQGLVGPACHRDTDRDVRARAQPRQRHGERGLQRHEHGHALGARQLHQCAVQGRRDLDVGAVPAARGLGGTGPVGGQVQLRRRPVEGISPVRYLTRHEILGIGFLAEEFPLPQRVIGVLDRQRHPRGVLARQSRRVRRGHVAGQRLHRPGVARDVVHHQNQNVVIRRDREQRRPYRRRRGQVERVPRHLRDRAVEIPERHLGDIQREPALFHRKHPLVRFSPGVPEHRTQHLVPLGHVTQRRGERRPVQGPGQAQRHRDVVGGARPLQLSEEPQPPLRERQRHGLRPVPRHQRRASRRGDPGEPDRQALGCGSLEQGAQRQLHRQRHAHLARQPHRQQGMPAQREEIVLHPDRRQPEDVGERLTQQLLDDIRRSAAHPRRVLRRRQCRPVHLPVDRQRELLQLHESRGDQVVRQPLGRVVPDGLGDRAVLGHQVADEPFAAQDVFPDDHRRLRDRRVSRENRFDLTRLHPKTTNLHLIVSAPREHQTTIRIPLHPITRAIHPITRTTERTRHKTLSRPQRTIQIPTRDTRTRDVQLTGHTDRDRSQSLVQHVHPRVVQRSSDRQNTGDLTGNTHFMLRRTQRHLGRPIQMPDHHTGIRLQHPPHRIRRNHVPTREHLTHPGETARVLVDEHAEQTRRHMHMGQLVPGDQPPQHRRVHTLDRRHHHRATRQQRHPQLVRRRVKSMRRMKQHPRRPTPAAILRQPHHIPVRGHNTLRHPRRPRRIHHIRGPIGRYLTGQAHHGVHVGIGRNRREAEFMTGRRLVHHEYRGAGVFEHRAHPRFRPARVQRHVRGPGLEDREQRHHQVGRTLHQHRDHRFRPGPGGHQRPREPVRTRVQLSVGERAPVPHHRHRVRIRHRPSGEGVRHRGVRNGHCRVVPLAHQLGEFGRVQQFHRVDGQIRVRGHRRQHPDQTARDPFHRVGAEQVGRAGDHAADPRRCPRFVEDLAQCRFQIELGRRPADREHFGVQAGDLKGGAVVQRREDDLEQGMSSQCADGGELLDQPLEGHVLVGEGAHRGGAHAVDGLGERRVPGQIGSDHERVDEEPDQVVEGLVGTPGGRCPDGDVMSRAEPGQRHRQPGLEEHRQRGTASAGQGDQLAVHRRWNTGPDRVPAV